MLCDSEWIILSWNRAGKEITGFSAEGLIGCHLDSILSEGSRKLLDGTPRRFNLDCISVSLNSIGLQNPVDTLGKDSPTALGTQGIARDITEIDQFREFSRQVSAILPICTICRRIRIPAKGGDEWIPLEEYLSRKTVTQFSHAYCPEHLLKVD